MGCHDACAPGYQCSSPGEGNRAMCAPAFRTELCELQCASVQNCFLAYGLNGEHDDRCEEWILSKALKRDLFSNGGMHKCTSACPRCRQRCGKQWKAWGFQNAKKCNLQMCGRVNDANDSD